MPTSDVTKYRRAAKVNAVKAAMALDGKKGLTHGQKTQLLIIAVSTLEKALIQAKHALAKHEESAPAEDPAELIQSLEELLKGAVEDATDNDADD